ncbi:polygalacturonase-like [Nicotiana tabacum]|uniref:Polygalacturonase-like n=1 Tax=Nicotiana tabacum TaxID=4097 RepID=A0AC58TL00_TOBAC
MSDLNLDKLVKFVARGDGRTDSTRAFLRAWSAACKSASPANVDIQRGTYLVRTWSFNGHCRRRIKFRIDGTLSAPANYNAIWNSEFWIMFYKVSGLSVYGSGAINANGHGYWSCRKSGGSCPQGARAVEQPVLDDYTRTLLRYVACQSWSIPPDVTYAPTLKALSRLLRPRLPLK